jgi:hypothetical protein
MIFNSILLLQSNGAAYWVKRESVNCSGISPALQFPGLDQMPIWNFIFSFYD